MVAGLPKEESQGEREEKGEGESGGEGGLGWRLWALGPAPNLFSDRAVKARTGA